MLNCIVGVILYFIANVILKIKDIDILDWQWWVISMCFIIGTCTICDKPFGKR